MMIHTHTHTRHILEKASLTFWKQISTNECKIHLECKEGQELSRFNMHVGAEETAQWEEGLL